MCSAQGTSDDWASQKLSMTVIILDDVCAQNHVSISLWYERTEVECMYEKKHGTLCISINCNEEEVSSIIH